MAFICKERPPNDETESIPTSRMIDESYGDRLLWWLAVFHFFSRLYIFFAKILIIWQSGRPLCARVNEEY